MIRRLIHLCCIVLLCAGARAGSGNAPADVTVLPNGLTLVTVENHREPIVSIMLWYHVGSKDERPGRTGFAHLFEHVMFEGSEHHRANFVQAIEAAGGSGINGVTNQDRTAYLETVPASSLDYALWLEADRMGYLLGAVDQKILDGQRAVIENEHKQVEDVPYSAGNRLIAENTYPWGHPYRRSAAAENADLQAASLGDVRQWFESYYGAANAVLVLAGDITPAAAKEKVQKYFAGIPAGQPVAHQVAWVAKMTGTHRQTVQDRVSRPRVYKVWNIPEFGSAESVYLDLVSDCLGRGKSSRLYQALVSRSKIASDVRASVQLNEIGGQFRIEVTVQPDHTPADGEKIIDDEVAKFLKDGPSTEELARLKAQYVADYYRNMDRLGGLGSRSDRLAQSVAFGRGVDAYALALERVQNATANDLSMAARKWLSDGAYVLNVLPFSFTKSSKQAVAVQEPPIGPISPVKWPALERTTLPNGLKVLFSPRHDVPLVNLWLSIDAGFAADPCNLPGVATMSLAMLDAGTTTRSGAEIHARLESLGTELRTETDFDVSLVKMSALKSNLAASIDLFSDVIMHPAYPAAEFGFQQKQELSAIQREESTPMYMALRTLPGLLYQPGCLSANPFSGTGTPASVQQTTREELVHFHDIWFRPNNATLIVAGDVTLAELRSLLEKAFANWMPAPVPAKNRVQELPPGARPGGIYLVDKPGAAQSFVMVAGPGLPKTDPADLAAEAVNDVLGGNLGSRLNLNLREGKHWSYGVRSRLWSIRGSQIFLTYGAFQAEKTAEAITEIKKEFTDVQSARPVNSQELADIKINEALRLPASVETLDSVTEWMAEMTELRLGEDYFSALPDRITALTASQVAEGARDLIHPDQMLWIVVGDKSKLESSLKEAGMKNVRILAARQRPE